MKYSIMVLVLAFSSFPTENLHAQAPPSYAKHVRPFIAKYCLECHNPKSAKGGLTLETYKGIFEGGNKGEVLVPGKPDESRLIALIEGQGKEKMPPKTARFHPKAEEIALVRAWVKAGAKDDSSQIKVVLPDIKPRKLGLAPITALAYHPATGLAAAQEKKILFLDPDNPRLKERKTPAPVSALAFASRGNVLLAAYGLPGSPARLEFFFLEVKPPVLSEAPDLHADSILDIACSADGKHFATCSYDTQVKIFPLSLSEEITARHTLKEHSDAVYAVVFSPDSRQLASCSADRAVKVFDVASGKLLYTLGEATDWLYTLAWSPDGKHLASAGVDKSIRIYNVTPTGGKIVKSVFAHEGPVQKIAYSKDGKTLYSLGQDRVLKAWDAERMVERKVYDRFPETPLSLAVLEKALAVGRYDGVVQILDEKTGKPLAAPHASLQSPSEPKNDPYPIVDAGAGNNSPGTGQLLKLPVSVTGKLEKAGDVDFFRFEVRKGQHLGMHLLTKAVGSKVEPILQLTDKRGNVLAEAETGFLGYVFPEAGTYALGVRDREFRGGADMHYRLRLGEIPVVTSIFPLGVQRGGEAAIHLKGVFLGKKPPSSSGGENWLDGMKVNVTVPKDTAVGSTVPVPLITPLGKPLGNLEVVVGEFPDTLAAAPSQGGFEGAIPVPSTGNGYLNQPGQHDTWKFSATKGQRLILEVNARRLGSALDSVLEILDAKGQPVPRAVLRCQAKTFVTFRDNDSATPTMRIEAWSELAVNDMIYVGSELMKIQSLPTHPDADCVFFSVGGQRTGYLDTTPTHHSVNEPMYKVTLHPPGTPFPPNGYPVFTLYYRNDDGGPGYGRDSRLVFDPPADGDYLVRIADSRGQAGDNFGYRLTVRPPRPSFSVHFSPTNPMIWRGGALPINITAERQDGYDGPIHLQFADLPPGFSAPATTLDANQNTTAFALYAAPDAQTSEKPMPLRLISSALINGAKITQEARGDTPKAVDPGDIVTATEEAEITVKPGGQVKLTVHIERRNGFKGRVPLDVRGLPHGIRVLDIGLNGILVNESETRRTIVIYAEPWVEPSAHPFVVFAKREGKNTEHGAKSVVLKVLPK